MQVRPCLSPSRHNYQKGPVPDFRKGPLGGKFDGAMPKESRHAADMDHSTRGTPIIREVNDAPLLLQDGAQAPSRFPARRSLHLRKEKPALGAGCQSGLGATVLWKPKPQLNQPTGTFAGFPSFPDLAVLKTPQETDKAPAFPALPAGSWGFVFRACRARSADALTVAPKRCCRDLVVMPDHRARSAAFANHQFVGARNGRWLPGGRGVKETPTEAAAVMRLLGGGPCHALGLFLG
jgi:hypothetical protein